MMVEWTAYHNTYDPVFEVLLQHDGAPALLHVELARPVDVEDGGEVLGVAVEEKLRRVARDKLITEFKNLRTIQHNISFKNH